MTTSGCPNDETFTRLVEGLLPEAELRALEAHCDGCPTCARLMAELARSLSPSGGGSTGLLGDRYRLLETLGAGGMGVVYAAFDTKLGRKVAIKRLRETGNVGSAAEKRRVRFLREAQLLASLSHPNVLTVHDVGGADREQYVVMELVDGAPVSRWLTETRPGWRRIVDVFLQAGRGLVAAHQLGIVHRDVKPDNILVANNGRVLVGDFGLAGLAGSSAPTASPSPSPGTLTETGAILGTPAYMAPEQHDGKAGDAQSDQFSFAVSLYESLHGRRPFAGRSAGEIAAASRSGQLAMGGDGVPRSVDRVLARALAADPASRYPSLEDLLAAIESAHEQRRPGVAAIAGVVLLAAGGAAAALWWPRPTAHPPAAIPAPAPATTETRAPEPPTEPAPAPSTARKPRVRLAQAPADAKQILERATSHDLNREGAACLAALDEVKEWPGDMAEMADRIRGDCLMLTGRCDAGKKLLEPIYMHDKRQAEKLRTVMLDRRVLEMCPMRSIPTLSGRIHAVLMQADNASHKHPGWCRQLTPTLARDTESAEMRACLRARAAGEPLSPSCDKMVFPLQLAQRSLASCLLKDGDCRNGAAFDIMNGQLGWSRPPGDDDGERWCRPDHLLEYYPSCTAYGHRARDKCLARFDEVKRGGGVVVPELP